MDSFLDASLFCPTFWGQYILGRMSFSTDYDVIPKCCRYFIGLIEKRNTFPFGRRIDSHKPTYRQIGVVKGSDHRLCLTRWPAFKERKMAVRSSRQVQGSCKNRITVTIYYYRTSPRTSELYFNLSSDSRVMHLLKTVKHTTVYNRIQDMVYAR